MPQTLLALVAVMMASLFAFQQQRYVLDMRMDMIRNEIATQATSVAVDRLEEIRAMSFDEATKGENNITSQSDLTLKDHFTDDAPPIDDVDDFDGATVQRFRVVGTDTLWFEVTTQVAYAQEADPDATISDVSVRTKFKKATVWVHSLNTSVTDTIAVAQSVACGSKCKW